MKAYNVKKNVKAINCLQNATTDLLLFPNITDLMND